MTIQDALDFGLIVAIFGLMLAVFRVAREEDKDD